jgi:hypothetical protein
MLDAGRNEAEIQYRRLSKTSFYRESRQTGILDFQYSISTSEFRASALYIKEGSGDKFLDFALSEDLTPNPSPDRRGEKISQKKSSSLSCLKG